jgi:hypothetical protein
MRPLEYSGIVGYCGSWSCTDFRKSKPGGRDDGDQGKVELNAKLVSVVDKLEGRMERMEGMMQENGGPAGPAPQQSKVFKQGKSSYAKRAGQTSQQEQGARSRSLLM